MGKRKAGIKLPNKPVISKFFTCVLLSCLMRGRDKGRSTLAAATIRYAPTSPGENTSNHLLIKIKELPQINVSTTNRIQFLREFSEFVSGICGVLGLLKVV